MLRIRHLLPELATILGYLLLTMIFTYPMSVHLAHMVVGIAGDAESHLWSFWWMRKALIEQHTTPYFTVWLYYPEGVSLYFYAYNVVHALLSIPLQELFGLIVAYNLTEIFGFVVAGWTASWLVRYVTGSRRAGFVGGIVYTFAPIQLFHFNLGQPNLHGGEFLPLYVLCLWRWLNGGPYRWMLGAVIALVLNSYSDWQFALYAHIFTIIVIVARMIQWFRGETLPTTPLAKIIWRVAMVEILYVVAVSPVVIPMVQELSRPQPYMFRPLRDTVYHSPDLLSLLIPNPENPLWRAWARPAAEYLKTPGITIATVSLSYVALLLACIAVKHHWQQARFWLVCGIIFLVLALGPNLRVFGTVTEIPLPYTILFQSSIIRITRAPARYIIITTLCLAVLAGIGVQNVGAAKRRAQSYGTQSAKRRVQSYGAWNVQYAIILVVLCVELLPVPVNGQYPAVAPPFMTNGTLQGAVMEIPDPSNRGMYYATIHNRPVSYGEMSRDNPPGPILDYLRNRLFVDDIVHDTSSWRCVANFFTFTHLIVYRQLLISADIEQQIKTRWGETPALFESPELALYAIPFEGLSDTCAIIDQGWSKARPLAPDKPLYRWMSQQGTIAVFHKRPGPVILRFDAHSFAIPRHIEIYRDGRLIGQFDVGTPQSFAVQLDLPAGVNWLELRSVEPALSPADYGYTKEEAKLVTVGFSNIHVQGVKP